MNQQTEVKARHPVRQPSSRALDTGSSRSTTTLDSGSSVRNDSASSSQSATSLDSGSRARNGEGARRNDGAVVIPLNIAKANIPAGPKLLFGMCASQVSEEKPEFVFNTGQFAENLGCHPSTISRRKEMLLQKGLLEETGEKEGRLKIYRLVWEFIEHVAETVRRVIRKILPKPKRIEDRGLRIEQGKPEQNSQTQAANKHANHVQHNAKQPEVEPPSGNSLESSRQAIADSLKPPAASRHANQLTQSVQQPPLNPQSSILNPRREAVPPGIFDAELIKRCQGWATYEDHPQTLPCLLHLYYDRWQKQFPHVNDKSGYNSIEGVIIEHLERYFPGRWTNLWFSIEKALEAREERAKNPRTEAEKEQIRAYAKRLGYDLKVD